MRCILIGVRVDMAACIMNSQQLRSNYGPEERSVLFFRTQGGARTWQKNVLEPIMFLTTTESILNMNSHGPALQVAVIAAQLL